MTLVADYNSSVNVPFQRMRQLLLDGALQEGVVNAGDLAATQRGAGANMSTDVAAGLAWVKIDTGTRNGLGHATSDAVANVTVTAAHATLPRLDQIILRWNDTSIPTGAGNVPTLEVLTGTATGGATLDNRTGAAALPNDCMRLADVLVGAAVSSITNAVIRDRRPWARGALVRINLQSSNITSASTSMINIDGTNLAPRVEFSGAPARVTLMGEGATATAGDFFVQFLLDNTAINGRTDTFMGVRGQNRNPFNLMQGFVPAAGSHLVIPQWQGSTTNTRTLYISATAGLEMIVEEIVRQNTPNNATPG